MIGKWMIRFILAAVSLFGLIQFIPRGDMMKNPPVLQEPVWDSVETQALVQRACYDCHSNETNWPWYAKVQPMAMLLANDVAKGRSVLNFSEWDGESIVTVEYIEHVVRTEKMPLQQYLLLHPEAKLSTVEKEQLIAGLSNSLN